MKNRGFILFILLLLSSCTVLYEADIDNQKQIPVIDAYIGNTTGVSYVRLSYSLPFDSLGIPEKISYATVYVTDNTNKKTIFMETTPGLYKPAGSFNGEINKTYTLTVVTPDKQTYKSNPEIMLPLIDPVKVSGGYSTYTTLFENLSGQVIRRDDDVCEIYFDFKTDLKEIPRFRFTSSQIVEYTVTKGTMSEVTFFCWYVIEDHSLRFTNEKYASGSGEIKNQLVGVMNADGRLTVNDMSLEKLSYADTVVTLPEYKRIIRINQYRLNPDSYTWYKGIESQSSSEGKIFDPLTSQLYGNIICETDPEKPVFGFFEVSPVITRSWAVSRGGPGITIKITSVPNIYPSSQGFTINWPPAFWLK